MQHIIESIIILDAWATEGSYTFGEAALLVRKIINIIAMRTAGEIREKAAEKVLGRVEEYATKEGSDAGQNPGTSGRVGGRERKDLTCICDG